MIYLGLPFALIKIPLAVVGLAKNVTSSVRPIIHSPANIKYLFSKTHQVFSERDFLPCILLWTYSHPLQYHRLFKISLLSSSLPFLPSLSPIPFNLAVLGTEPWTLHILGEHCTSELSCLVFYFQHFLILYFANTGYSMMLTESNEIYDMDGFDTGEFNSSMMLPLLTYTCPARSEGKVAMLLRGCKPSLRWALCRSHHWKQSFEKDLMPEGKKKLFSSSLWQYCMIVEQPVFISSVWLIYWYFCL